MKKDNRVKFETDIEQTGATIKARKPVKISRDNRRQYVRLEIVSPLWLRRIKDIFGTFTPEPEDELTAEILNISAGGVLVEVDHPLNEGDIVAMRFRLQGLDSLDNVLGLVKRVDKDGEGFLSGIEFTSRERLRDRLGEAELDLLGERATDFNESVRQVLSRYLYTDSEANRA